MSQVDVAVPEIGESIAEAVIANWTKEDKQHVQKDETICELESDKANVEVYASAEGTLNISAKEGDTVKVGEVIAKIDQEASSEDEERSSEDHEEQTENKSERKEKSTSSKRKLKEGETREPMSRFRLSMAKRLVKAQNETASTTTFNDVDLSKVIKKRKEVQKKFQEIHDVKLGYMSIFIKAVSASLKEYPLLNSQIEKDLIIKNKNVHMGVAISRGNGLVVPVILNIEDKTHAQIEKELNHKAKKAEDGNLDMNEMTGGTFTITNGGVFGSLLSTPILNPPQVAILGMHRIEQRPVAVKTKTGEFEIKLRPMMNLALTYDHRLIEGKESVMFLNSIKNYLSSFELDKDSLIKMSSV